MQESRRLVSIRRTVEPASRSDYDRQWSDLRAMLTAADGRAWRFASADQDGVFVEYLEHRSGDPRDFGGIAEALKSLERYGPADTETWVEAN